MVSHTGALRRDLIARYPGYRDYIEPKVREVDELYLAQARFHPLIVYWLKLCA
jgi:hypothetical protein